jgi:hypothetical protein
MSTTEQQEILKLLQNMDPEQVRQVRDFTLFLKVRYKSPLEVDESDSWTEEDMRDATAACLRYADEAMPYEEDQENQSKDSKPPLRSGSSMLRRHAIDLGPANE